MKLELKHVINYPLGNDGIKMITSESQGSRVTPITQIDFTEPDLVYGNSYLDMNDGYYPYSLGGCKLFLRSLDCLTKEIHYNGENFVPIEIINKDGYPQIDDHGCLYYADGESGLLLPQIQYIYNKLFECHFDVYRLIEEGLAIDINTHNP